MRVSQRHSLIKEGCEVHVISANATKISRPGLAIWPAGRVLSRIYTPWVGSLALNNTGCGRADAGDKRIKGSLKHLFSCHMGYMKPGGLER